MKSIDKRFPSRLKILFPSLMSGCSLELIVDKAYFDIDNEEKLKRLKSLLFVKDDSKTLDNMNEFMDKCKKCKGMQ